MANLVIDFTALGRPTIEGDWIERLDWDERSKKGTIVMKDGITAIPARASYGCKYPVFLSVTIPEEVTKIGGCAFYFCSSLESVSIPDSVTKIGGAAFHNCNLPKDFTRTVAGLEFRGELCIKDGVVRSTTTQSPAITIPDGIREIGHGAFFFCESLESVGIPESVTKIDDEAFDGCKSLTTVSIPKSITEIGDFAFCDYEFLTSVTVPENVKLIGRHTFGDCKNTRIVMLAKNFVFTDLITDYGDKCERFGDKTRVYV